MKITRQKIFDDLQEALDFLSKANWEEILNKFGLDDSLNMSDSIVKLKIKSIDGISCKVNLTITLK